MLRSICIREDGQGMPAEPDVSESMSGLIRLNLLGAGGIMSCREAVACADGCLI